jgi:exopolysaccharide biosynthesis polyprenyl glycosylphosphotransferase
MNGSVATGQVARGRTVASKSNAVDDDDDARAVDARGEMARSDGATRRALPERLVNVVVAVQFGALAAIILTELLFPFTEQIGALTAAYFIDSVLLLCGFAILANRWVRRDIARGQAAIKEIAERGAHIAFLVLAATFVSASLTGVSWEYLTPTRTFIWLLSVAAAGVLALAGADWLWRGSRIRCVAVFGDGEPAFQLAQRVRAEMPRTRVCLISTDQLASYAQPFQGEPFYADPKIVELAPEVAIINSLACDAQTIEKLAAHLAPLPLDVLIHAPYRGSWGRGPVVTFARLPFVRMFPKPLLAYQRAIKRAFDIVSSAALLVLLLPVFSAAAVAIKLDSRGPIFFRQPRVGVGGVHFTIFKFRSMRVDAGDLLANQLTTRNDPRLTGVGSFLRKSSIDELPQLLNVLFGSMSLVGPRPHPLNAKANGDFYGKVVANYQARHRVKPGITGLAQVLGWRGPTDTHAQIEQRVANDLRYISAWSFFQDLLILVRTAFTLFGKNAQ